MVAGKVKCVLHLRPGQMNRGGWRATTTRGRGGKGQDAQTLKKNEAGKVDKAALDSLLQQLWHLRCFFAAAAAELLFKHQPAYTRSMPQSPLNPPQYPSTPPQPTVSETFWFEAGKKEGNFGCTSISVALQSGRKTTQPNAASQAETETGGAGAEQGGREIRAA